MNAERPRPRAFRLDDSGKVVLDEATPARAAPVVEEAPDPYEREAELALTAGDQSEQAVEVASRLRASPLPDRRPLCTNTKGFAEREYSTNEGDVRTGRGVVWAATVAHPSTLDCSHKARKHPCRASTSLLTGAEEKLTPQCFLRADNCQHQSFCVWECRC